jgi:hypothetical protein
MAPLTDSWGLGADDIEAARDGTVWISLSWSKDSRCCSLSTEALVARYDGQRWTAYGKDDGLDVEDQDVGQLSLAIAPDGSVWLSGPRGLASFRDGRWTVRYAGGYIGRIAYAPDGTLWASGELGVIRIVDPPH